MDKEELSRIRAKAGRRGGLKGGKAKVAKGLAKMSKAKRAETSAKGVKARRKKDEK